MEKIRVEQHGFAGILWIMGWLFSIGFLDLALEQGIFAIVIWPYYVGQAVAALVR